MTDQAAGLRRKVQSKSPGKRAETISIVSGKGGVGKSNFAVNFSLELIQQGNKVLLFDLDIGMGNIDILLGRNAGHTITDLLDNKLPADEVIEEGQEGLAYIAGGSGLADLFKMDKEKLDYFLAQYETLTQAYDYIIFDIGAGVSDDSMSFILASDVCFVVTTPEPTAITDAYGMIKHIVSRQGTMPLYILLNRAEKGRGGLRVLEGFQQIIDQFLHVKMYSLGILPEDHIVSKSVISQTPYVLLDKKADISKQMKQIVLNYLSGSAEEIRQRPISFMRKLKQLMTGR